MQHTSYHAAGLKMQHISYYAAGFSMQHISYHAAGFSMQHISYHAAGFSMQHIIYHAAGGLDVLLREQAADKPTQGKLASWPTSKTNRKRWSCMANGKGRLRRGRATNTTTNVAHRWRRDQRCGMGRRTAGNKTLWDFV